MRRRHGVARGVALALLAACAPLRATAAPPAPLPDSLRVPAGIGVPSVPVSRVDSVPVVAASDLARLLGATEYWRSDVRKLVLRLGDHRLTFTADNPFMLVDDHTVRFEAMVVSRAGELQIPVEVARALPRDGSWPHLAYDPDARQMRVAPSAGFVGVPRIEPAGALTTVVVPTERPDAVVVLGRSRARFRLRMAGGLAGALPDSLPAGALVHGMAVAPVPGGLVFQLAIAPEATGWRLERDPGAGRVRLVLARGGTGFEAFASEGAPGPRVLRCIVLDPGHGGSDAGARIEGTDEKSLALELARLVAAELSHRTNARVVLTRNDDRDVSQEERAEIANHARADAVVSLHFEPLPASWAHGALAWCPAAAAGSGSEAAASAAGLVTLRPWRDAAIERAVESRGLAESITSALERGGFNPTAVRERLPEPLVGVHPPGVLLDCGTLANPGERAHQLGSGWLRALAAAIADGLLAWPGVSS